MKISPHARLRLRQRFNLHEHVDQTIVYRVAHSHLLKAKDLYEIGSQYRMGYTYLAYEDMILICKNDTLTSVLYNKRMPYGSKD
jgi:hypothetical protein